jgi:hypothetical protein
MTEIPLNKIIEQLKANKNDGQLKKEIHYIIELYYGLKYFDIILNDNGNAKVGFFNYFDFDYVKYIQLTKTQLHKLCKIYNIPYKKEEDK